MRRRLAGLLGVALGLALGLAGGLGGRGMGEAAAASTAAPAPDELMRRIDAAQADLRTLSAEFVQTSRHIIGAAGELTCQCAGDGCFARYIPARTWTSRKRHAGIPLVTFDGFYPDKPNLRRVCAMRAPTRRDVEVANRHDPHVVGDLGLTT